MDFFIYVGVGGLVLVTLGAIDYAVLWIIARMQ